MLQVLWQAVAWSVPFACEGRGWSSLSSFRDRALRVP